MNTNASTLSNLCFETLKKGIIRGDFKPGEKLRIAKLKDILNAGPTPIREALSRLVSTGLIYAEDNRGFYVSKVSENEVRDIYSTFLKIEILALTQAIELGETDWEASILSALHKLSTVEKSSSPNIDQWMLLNYQFHLALISGCGSPCLLKVREDLYQQFERYCRASILSNENILIKNNKDHAELAKAVIDRDISKTTKLITKHLNYSLQLVLSKLKKMK